MKNIFSSVGTNRTKSRKFSGLMLTLFLILSTVSFSGCEDDDWAIRDFFLGEWEVVDVFAYDDYCPYVPGDHLSFRENRRVYFDTHPEYAGYGTWDIDGNHLLMGIGNSGIVDIDAAIESMDMRRGVVVLDVCDDWWESDYKLRLVKVSY